MSEEAPPYTAGVPALQAGWERGEAAFTALLGLLTNTQRRALHLIAAHPDFSRSQHYAIGDYTTTLAFPALVRAGLVEATKQPDRIVTTYRLTPFGAQVAEAIKREG